MRRDQRGRSVRLPSVGRQIEQRPQRGVHHRAQRVVCPGPAPRGRGAIQVGHPVAPAAAGPGAELCGSQPYQRAGQTAELQLALRSRCHRTYRTRQPVSRSAGQPVTAATRLLAASSSMRSSASGSVVS
jgi:hypothetical protein